MTHFTCWATFQQILREMSQANPHYHWENEWPTGPWKPPSAVPRLPAIPLVVDCKSMGLDPRKLQNGPVFLVPR